MNLQRPDRRRAVPSRSNPPIMSPRSLTMVSKQVLFVGFLGEVSRGANATITGGEELSFSKRSDQFLCVVSVAGLGHAVRTSIKSPSTIRTVASVKMTRTPPHLISRSALHSLSLCISPYQSSIGGLKCRKKCGLHSIRGCSSNTTPRKRIPGDKGNPIKGVEADNGAHGRARAC